MTYKQKVEYLSTYRFEVAKIASCASEYEKWMTIGTKVNKALTADDAQNGGAAGSPEGNKVEKSAIEMARIAKIIEAEMQAAEENRLKIMETIKTKSKNRRYALLLEMRYVDGKSIGKIARELEKSYKHVSHLISRAVNTLDI